MLSPNIQTYNKNCHGVLQTNSHCITGRCIWTFLTSLTYTSFLLPLLCPLHPFSYAPFFTPLTYTYFLLPLLTLLTYALYLHLLLTPLSCAPHLHPLLTPLLPVFQLSFSIFVPPVYHLLLSITSYPLTSCLLVLIFLLRFHSIYFSLKWSF